MASSNKLLSNLRKAHEKLTQVFSQDKDTDKKLAEDLEAFLNYVIYPNKNKTLASNNSISKIMSDDAIAAMRKDSNLQKLFGSTRLEGYKDIGEQGEYAFATAILQIIRASVEKKIQDNTEAQIKANMSDIVMGKQTATILAKENLEAARDSLKRQIEANKTQVSIREYSSWDARMGKIDIGFASVEIKNSISNTTQQLLNITASVKSYSSFTVELEEVNRQKAYLAIMSEALSEDFSTKKKLDSSIDLLENNTTTTEKEGVEIKSHMQHLINLYALTGYGQTYIDKAAKKIESNFARFLMLNNTAEQVIKIKSTKEIVSNVILNKPALGESASDKSSSGTFSGTSTIYYHF